MLCGELIPSLGYALKPRTLFRSLHVARKRAALLGMLAVFDGFVHGSPRIGTYRSGLLR